MILALGTNHLNFGYESSGYETSMGTKRPDSDFDADLKGHHHHLSLNKEALKEQQEIRILCWVMTSPENLPIKGKPVKETWGKAMQCSFVYEL